MRFSDLPSPLSGTNVSVADRLDPYWDGLWEQGTQGVWSRYDEIQRQRQAKLGRLPGIAKMSEDDAWHHVLSPVRWNEKLAALSVIDAFRTASIEQIAALTGSSMALSEQSALMAGLFNSGLVDVGRAAGNLAPTIASRVGYLLRPARTKMFRQRLAPHLTYPEYVSVTGGLGWQPGGFYDRHNVLSTELALRVAELCDVGTVLGEKFASFDLLFGSGVGREPISTTARGDGLIVRADGLRIVFELTASLPATTDENRKFTRWAQYFDSASFESNATVVVFVVANPINTTSPIRPRQVRMRAREALSMYPGHGKVRGRDRMFMVSWDDWFPGPGECTEDFLSLAVTPVLADVGSQKVHLLDPYNLEVDTERFDPFAIMDNAAGLASVPYWIRSQFSPPQLINLLYERHGIHPFPVAPPRKKSGPGRTIFRRNSTGSANVPVRLRTLTTNVVTGAQLPPACIEELAISS